MFKSIKTALCAASACGLLLASSVANATAVWSTGSNPCELFYMDPLGAQGMLSVMPDGHQYLSLSVPSGYFNADRVLLIQDNGDGQGGTPFAVIDVKEGRRIALTPSVIPDLEAYFSRYKGLDLVDTAMSRTRPAAYIRLEQANFNEVRGRLTSSCLFTAKKTPKVKSGAQG